MSATTANPVLAAIRERRSIRAFTEADVPDEALIQILEAGRWSPTGKNNQPQRFLVVKRGDKRISGLVGCTHYGAIVRSAAAVVCVFLDKDAMYSELKDHQSAGAAMQTMLLAVHALGLGAVWLGEIANQAPQVAQVLGTDPARHEFQGAIALGHPAKPGVASRMELADYLLEPFPA